MNERPGFRICSEPSASGVWTDPELIPAHDHFDPEQIDRDDSRAPSTGRLWQQQRERTSFNKDWI